FSAGLAAGRRVFLDDPVLGRVSRVFGDGAPPGADARDLYVGVRAPAAGEGWRGRDPDGGSFHARPGEPAQPARPADDPRFVGFHLADRDDEVLVCDARV